MLAKGKATKPARKEASGESELEDEDEVSVIVLLPAAPANDLAAGCSFRSSTSLRCCQ